MKYADFVDRLFTHPETMDSSQLNLLHAAVGLAGEAGELLDAVKKVVWQGHKLDPNKLKNELGDIRFYFQAICNVLETSEEEIRGENIEKLLQRYPTGHFVIDRSVNRDEK